MKHKTRVCGLYVVLGSRRVRAVKLSRFLSSLSLLSTTTYLFSCSFILSFVCAFSVLFFCVCVRPTSWCVLLNVQHCTPHRSETDFETGLCTCLDGWASSDGNASTGDRGDCGYHYEFCTDETQVQLTLVETFALLQAAAS